MPLPGFSYGVVFVFLNAQGEQLDAQGNAAKGQRSPGFSIGVNRKTLKPKNEMKRVAVPPNAVTLQATVTKFSKGNVPSGLANDYSVSDLIAAPVP